MANGILAAVLHTLCLLRASIVDGVAAVNGRVFTPEEMGSHASRTQGSSCVDFAIRGTADDDEFLPVRGALFPQQLLRRHESEHRLDEARLPRSLPGCAGGAIAFLAGATGGKEDAGAAGDTPVVDYEPEALATA